MSVARAQAEISSAEFTEWMAHYRLSEEEMEGSKIHWNDLVAQGRSAQDWVRHG